MVVTLQVIVHRIRRLRIAFGCCRCWLWLSSSSSLLVPTSFLWRLVVAFFLLWSFYCIAWIATSVVFLLLSSLSLLFLLLMLGCKDQNRLLLIPLPMSIFSCIFFFCTIWFLLFLDTTHNNQSIVVVSAVFIIFMVCSFLMVRSFPVLVAIGLVEIHGTGRRFLLDAGVSVFVICPPLLVFSNLGEENRGLRVGVWDRSSSSPLSFNSFPFRSRLPLLLFLLGVVLDDWGIHQDVKKEGSISLYGTTCRMELLRCQK